MKKTLCALILSVLVVTMLASTSFAASNEILKGTPEVDGVLDSIYEQSLVLHMDETTAEWSYNGMPDVVLDIYMLYDEDYIYVCNVGTDSDIVPADADWADNAWPWQNDNLEANFDFGEGKVAIMLNFSSIFDHVIGDVSGVKVAGSTDGKNFIVEYAIPNATSLKAGSELLHYTQIDDRLTDAASTCAQSYKGQGDGALIAYKLSANEVEYPVEIVEEDTVEEAAPVEAVEAAAAPAAAQTADILSMAVISAVASLAAGVVIKKRK